MTRIALTAREPLNNGTWVHLPTGLWGNVELRLVAHHVVEERDPRFFELAGYRSVRVPEQPSMYMVLPQFFMIGETRVWRGRMIVRADDGSPDRRGAADIIHNEIPWVFLRSTGQNSPFPWVRDLGRRVAWLTPDGQDLREIATSPFRDQAGLLVFDVLGDVRAGGPATSVVRA